MSRDDGRVYTLRKSMNPSHHKSLPKDMRQLAAWIASADYSAKEMPLDLERPSKHVKEPRGAFTLSREAIEGFSLGEEIH